MITRPILILTALGEEQHRVDLRRTLVAGRGAGAGAGEPTTCEAGGAADGVAAVASAEAHAAMGTPTAAASSGHRACSATCSTSITVGATKWPPAARCTRPWRTPPCSPTW